MSDLAFLPRVFIAKTEHGTSFYWDRPLGLLACSAQAGTLRPVGPDELRRGYPAAWIVWLRFASLLPATELRTHPAGQTASSR
jgi:hypothetical protein